MKLPSLFDLQVNGFSGVDFLLPLTQSDLRKACEGLHERCMHRIFLTQVTNTPDYLTAQFERAEQIRAADPFIAETIPGYHLEGPFMSPEEGYRGAHPEECMHAPSLEEFERFQRAANGRIRLVTIAAEWPNSAEFTEKVTAQGVVVSIGHSNASDQQIDAVVRAGAKLCTHLGNGIPAQLHRHDNVMQRLLSRDDLIACLIPDGIHVPPGVLKNMFRAKPEGKAVFTTDCMSAANAPEGEYTIAHHRVAVGKDRVVRMPGSPYFAGSSLSLDTGAANVHHWVGIPALKAWELCSTKVADIFGIKLPEIEVPDNWPEVFAKRN